MSFFFPYLSLTEKKCRYPFLSELNGLANTKGGVTTSGDLNGRMERRRRSTRQENLLFFNFLSLFLEKNDAWVLDVSVQSPLLSKKKKGVSLSLSLVADKDGCPCAAFDVFQSCSPGSQALYCRNKNGTNRFKPLATFNCKYKFNL